MYLVKTPFFIKKLYSSLVWNIHTEEKVIYLSFDDGPIPEVTPFVLHQLKNFDAKATFFCIGDNVRKHPDIFSQVIDSGHRIGNHTFNHLNGWHTNDEKYVQNVDLCEPYFKSDIMRPPYGRISRSQIKLLSDKYKIIMWDILSGDFDESLSPNDCLKKVIKKTEKGSIVVFHDSIRAYPRLKHTLPLALKHWSDKGFVFSAIPI